MTVKEVSDLTGVSVRSLHHYDHVGLLKPASWTKSGYRIYGEKELVRLQQILFFKELGFSLKEIRTILDAPGFDWKKALEQQIELLTMKKEHIENMILFARGMKGIGLKYMDFKAFDTRKMDEYAKKAKETWGNTKEYRGNGGKESHQRAGTDCRNTDDGALCRVRRDEAGRPRQRKSAGTGKETAGIHHGTFLYLQQLHPARTGHDVRR